jgi:hypothetical protein
LSPSVKAGGYGTAGWSIGGDIIIDVSKLTEIDIEVPKEDGSFTSLRDVAPANSKGKKSQALSGINSSKRRREEDANLRVYDSASHAVASFLRGPPFPRAAPSANTIDGPSPSVRRRLEAPNSPNAPSDSSSPRELAHDSSNSSNSGFNSREQSASTIGTTPSPPPVDNAVTVFTTGNNNEALNVPAQPASHDGSANSDPFGYLETPSNFPPAPPPTSLRSNYNPPSVTASWPLGYGSSFANSPGQFGPMQIPARAEPIYPHAYVTFGAGMRQKEIDSFTAQHKLEARYLTGDGDGIPYHVPL